jgi:uncharacterized membrane protein (DUF485 family)
VRERADRAVARRDRSAGQLTRARGTRWPWLIAVVAVVAVKAEAYASLAHDRTGLVIVLTVGLAFAVLRHKPVAIGAFAAGILAFALAPHPVGAGVALGVGAFVLLIALFFAIATVLHARQPHAARVHSTTFEPRAGDPAA